MRACAGRAEIIICKQRHGPSYGWPIRMFPSRSCDSCSTTLNNERALDRNPAEPHNATRLKRQMSEKLPKTARRRRSVTFINCNWPHCGCKRNSDASPYFHKRRREGRRLIEERCVSWKDLVTTFNALTPEPGNNDGLSKRRVGSLHLEFKKCGRASCRCRSGLPHGPYVYRHRREGGRQRKEYVPMRHLRDVVLDMERQRAQTARPAEIRRVLKGLRDV
jgi:hypothetical protein